MERSHHLEGLLIMALLVALGGFFLWKNSQPAVRVSVPVATDTPAGEAVPDWQVALEAQIANASTPLPTPDFEMTAFVPPTLPPVTQNPDLILEPTQIQSTPWPTPTLAPTTESRPTESGPTPFPSPTGVYVISNESEGFAPPPEQVPLSPHANDHFWMVRPVDVSANSASLFYYAFGSDGPNDEYRVHHGVDMPNPVGEPVRAGSAGIVLWAGSSVQVIEENNVEIYPSYGNVVIIEHDFGYRGQKVWTLYAHMSAVLVENDQHVEAGDIIGLSGGTGDVSGPHVHLEVRLGQNNYFYVCNPLLWIAPYVGHGVVAGRVSYPDGTFIDDVTVTLSQRGRIIETTSTYVKPMSSNTDKWHIMPDPGWQENFVLGDIPEGTYEISVNVNGNRIARPVVVRAGTTNFVPLGVELPATPQPVRDEES